MMLFQTPTVDIRPAGLSTKALAELKSGDRNLGLGEFAAATGSYIRAMEAAPNSLVARWSLGLALSALRRSPALAVQQYREATRIAEDDLITALLLQGALQEYVTEVLPSRSISTPYGASAALVSQASMPQAL